jgi:hypothetical protein
MTARKTTEEAQLLRPDIRVVTVPIEGLSSLITHRWSEKARRQMLDKQQLRARAPREAKDPQAEYEASLYAIEPGRYGFPGGGYRDAIVSAARFCALKMTELRGAFYVIGDLVPIDGQPKMREDMVRIARGTADIRYRAEFPEWRADLRIQYNARALSAEQIVNLVSTAGFSIGIGEWRPERNGEHGRFAVRAG